MGPAVYDPHIFERVRTVAEAKAIILTPERHCTTDQRWQAETPHLADLIRNQIDLRAGSVVVDYGCGIGRIAKTLIERHRCKVIGTDISANMRALAASYVDDPRFVAIDPSMIDTMNVQADLVIAVWVLQHVADLPLEMARIRRMMREDGILFVVNEASTRFVPMRDGWIHDGVNVRMHLEMEFTPLIAGQLDPAVVGDEQSERTFWAAYR